MVDTPGERVRLVFPALRFPTDLQTQEILILWHRALLMAKDVLRDENNFY